MRATFERIEKIHHSLKQIGIYISGLAVIGMMLLIVTDVFLRNIYNMPLSGTYEITEYFLMPLAIFPALAYTYSSGILPRVSGLIEKTPLPVQNVVTYILLVIEIVIFGLLAVYGWELAMGGLSDNMAISISGKLTILYPVYFLVPFGFALVVLEVTLSAIRRFFIKTKIAG